jgi:endonuclease/exonuclease/phosphatase family metal-dependent hydrolase
MLSIMTLNVNFYNEKHGPWETRRQLIKEAVIEARPDIIALQAVMKDPDRENGVDQASQLASEMPEFQQVHYQPAVKHANGIEEGSAILSKYYFDEVSCRSFSSKKGAEDPARRIILHARYNFPLGPFHLFNAHFSWVEEQARQNLEETLAYMERYSGRRVLVGDMNNPPETDVIKNLAESGWHDAWAVNGSDNGYTFEADAPSKRIDYIWLQDDLVKTIGSTRIVKPAGEAQFSDHLGLLTELML